MAKKAKVERQKITIKPQPGPQYNFLACAADIAVYGGAVFSGKTYALLLDPVRFVEAVKGFGAVVFRRELRQITNEGGLWDESENLYKSFKPARIQSPYRITFPNGVKIEYHHLNQPDDVDTWDGSQIPGLYFDELQHFLESQFWYMISRNRTSCGIKAYCRATCNPVRNRNHWLRKFLAWWIDDDTGWPIKERSGVVRYFLRLKNVIHWADTAAELIKKFPTPTGEPERIPKSFTFIAATMADNPIGLRENPDYAGNIEAQVESERLRMMGNWNAQPSSGELFLREDFDIIAPAEVPWIQRWIRYWDRAGTVPSDVNPSPDYTAGARIGIDNDGITYITGMERFRFGPQKVMKRIKIRGKLELNDTAIVLEHDPGQAGKAEIAYYYKDFAGLPLEDTGTTPKASKIAVWRPFASQARAGRIKLVRGEWIEEFLAEAEAVIDGTQEDIHDDQIDAAAGGYMYLTNKKATGAQGGAELNVF